MTNVTLENKSVSYEEDINLLARYYNKLPQRSG